MAEQLHRPGTCLFNEVPLFLQEEKPIATEQRSDMREQLQCLEIRPQHRRLKQCQTSFKSHSFIENSRLISELTKNKSSCLKLVILEL